jgi:hypothetical protein
MASITKRDGLAFIVTAMTREPLFRRVIGPDFDRLHASIRAVRAAERRGSLEPVAP